MKKIKLGIIGTADIAFRRFLPALLKNGYFEYIGVASRTKKNTEKFIKEYGGIGYTSYDELLDDSNIEVVYIPLPPSLHFHWAKIALQKGKHVILEKPFTTKLEDTRELIRIAKERDLVVFENYMFMYHKQLEQIKRMIKEKELGDLRQYRMTFGFPMRKSDDFRYNKELGGGALLDCGGYTLKLASALLGERIQIVTSNLNYIDGYDVDMYGSATLQDEQGMIAQVSFGMDNAYRCELEVWGSKATLTATRIFTATDMFKPEAIIKTSNSTTVIELEQDDQFYNVLQAFKKCLQDNQVRENIYTQIEQQAILVEEIKKGDKRA